MGRMKRRMEMERASRTGRKTRTRGDGSGVWTCHWDREFWRSVRREEQFGGFMWIEISCWMDLRRSLGSCSPPPHRCPAFWCFIPPLGSLSRFASVCLRPIVHVHLPPPSGFSLSSITFSHFRFVVCDPVIHTLIHYTLNTNLGRPRTVSATG